MACLLTGAIGQKWEYSVTKTITHISVEAWYLPLLVGTDSLD